MERIETMTEKYDVRDIIAICRIPPEALPRFIAELPEILDAVRPLVLAYDAAGAPPQAYATLIKALTWLDDDKQTASVRMSVVYDDGKVAGDVEANWKFGK